MINAIKQDVLLRFLHIFQTLPIVAKAYFKMCQLFNVFIWNTHCLLICHRILLFPKTKGGTGSPHVNVYSYLAVVTRIWYIIHPWVPPLPPLISLLVFWCFLFFFLSDPSAFIVVGDRTVRMNLWLRSQCDIPHPITQDKSVERLTLSL